MKIEIQIWKRHKATSPTFQISKRATIDGICVRTTQQKKADLKINKPKPAWQKKAEADFKI